MPIYEFTCADCGADFEELVFGSSTEVSCPKCKGARTNRRMSTFAFRSSGRFVSGAGAGCGGCSCSPGNCSGCRH